MEKALEGSSEVQPQREAEKGGGGGVESDGEDGNEDVDVKVKVIEWEEFQDSLAHLFGLAAHLTKERVKREALSHQLETALEARILFFISHYWFSCRLLDIVVLVLAYLFPSNRNPWICYVKGLFATCSCGTTTAASSDIGTVFDQNKKV
jgi:hypothetical protein